MLAFLGSRAREPRKASKKRGCVRSRGCFPIPPKPPTDSKKSRDVFLQTPHLLVSPKPSTSNRKGLRFMGVRQGPFQGKAGKNRGARALLGFCYVLTQKSQLEALEWTLADSHTPLICQNLQQRWASAHQWIVLESSGYHRNTFEPYVMLDCGSCTRPHERSLTNELNKHQ